MLLLVSTLAVHPPLDSILLDDDKFTMALDDMGFVKGIKELQGLERDENVCETFMPRLELEI